MRISSRQDTGFVLLVERGQTRFPERPVDSERFLIGAGSNCQLQLAGEIPILHSIIVPEEDGLWIDAVVPSPTLVVNGRPVREAQLQPGDVIEIGAFVFCVDRLRPSTTEAADLPVMPESAEELVDAIDRELSMLSEVAAARERGAAALLQAAAAKAEEDVSENTLNGLIKQLRQRAEHLDRREAALLEQSQRLEQAQQQLAAQQSPNANESATESSPLRLTA